MHRTTLPRVLFALTLSTATLMWVLPRQSGVAALDPEHSTVALNPPRISNDGQTARVLVQLVDQQGHPASGLPVRLRPNAAFMASSAAITDAQGRVLLTTTVRTGLRHTSLSSGTVSLSVATGATSTVLPEQPRLEVYNRVAVLLQGLGTSMSCTDPLCTQHTFNSLVQQVLAPLGYTPGSTILNYSYRGGVMERITGQDRWLPQPYGRCDTIQYVQDSARKLRRMLLDYRARFPYTTFVLVGHSLGGLVGLQAIGYTDFLSQIGPAAIDKVITLDSPINGITAFRARTWLVDMFAGAWQLHSCSGQHFGLRLVAELSGLGDHSPSRQQQWATTARVAGIEILNVTNVDDVPVPEPYTLIDDGAAEAPSDRLRYSLGHADQLGHGAILDPAADADATSHRWADFTNTLRGYLQQSCLVFAAANAACRYPSIDRGM